MLVAIIGFLIFLMIALLCGTITPPTREEMFLLFASTCLLIFSWFYSKNREKMMDEDKKLKKREKA